MENASKALIIAGAILLSILIIGIGMYIYNQAANVMGNVNMDSQEIQAFNQQFEQYKGSINGSRARNLVSLLASNARQYSDDDSRQPYVGFDDNSGGADDLGGGELPASSSNLNGATPGTSGRDATSIEAMKPKTGATYKVSFNYDKSGLISGVLIDRE